MRQREGAYQEFMGAEAIFSHSPQYHASHGEIDGIVAEWIPGRRDDPTNKQNHLT